MEVCAENERLRETIAEWQAIHGTFTGDVHAACQSEIERLQAELARWKPSQCGKIFPVPRPGEVVKNCAREYDHAGPHQTETGEVWIFPNGA